jgi:hypothetical protein
MSDPFDDVMMTIARWIPADELPRIERQWRQTWGGDSPYIRKDASRFRLVDVQVSTVNGVPLADISKASGITLRHVRRLKRRTFSP